MKICIKEMAMQVSRWMMIDGKSFDDQRQDCSISRHHSINVGDGTEKFHLRDSSKLLPSITLGITIKDYLQIYHKSNLFDEITRNFISHSTRLIPSITNIFEIHPQPN